MGLENFTELEKLKKELNLGLSPLTKVDKLCNNENIDDKIDDAIEILEKNSKLFDDKTSEIQGEYNDTLSDVSKMKKVKKNESFYTNLTHKVEKVASLIKQYQSKIKKLSISKNDKIKLQEKWTIQKNLYNNRLKKPLIELKALEKRVSELRSEIIALEKDIRSARNDYRDSIIDARKDYSERCNSLTDISKSLDEDETLDKKQANLVVDIVGDINDARGEIYKSLNDAIRKLAYLKSLLSERNTKLDELTERKRTLTQNISIFCKNITDVLNDDLRAMIENIKNTK